MLGCFPFWGSLFALVSPLFQHATTAGCLEPEAAQFGCPKDGPYRPLFEESGCGRTWVPGGALRVFWESLVGLVFPPFGPCWVAYGLHAPCAFGILWGWNIRAVRRGGVPAVRGRLEPLSSAWLGSLHSFCCARLTLVFGTASQGSFGTRWRMSLSPQDRQTGSWHGRGGEAAGRPPIRSTPETLGHSGGPGGPSSTNGLLGVGGGQASSLCPRGTWPTFGIAYGSSSWRLQTASSARTFPRWRMSGTARTN